MPDLSPPRPAIQIARRSSGGQAPRPRAQLGEPREGPTALRISGVGGHDVTRERRTIRPIAEVIRSLMLWRHRTQPGPYVAVLNGGGVKRRGHPLS